METNLFSLNCTNFENDVLHFRWSGTGEPLVLTVSTHLHMPQFILIFYCRLTVVICCRFKRYQDFCPTFLFFVGRKQFVLAGHKTLEKG